MYTIEKGKVRCGSQYTDYRNYIRGVKQGDVCSPVSFSLFINDFALEIINAGRHGVNFSYILVELFILLFADDIVIGNCSWSTDSA